MIRKIFLCTLLILAGLIHLLKPHFFINAIPSFFIYKKQIILVTGWLEIFLAIGILIKKTRSLSARLITYYFILLIPVHIYVTINGIEMFGVSSKLALWIRTLLQYPLILLAYSFTKDAWVIEQVWRHVFFIHYKVDPKLIEKEVPFNLDLHEGSAVISIVPFYMEGIRFPLLPSFPKISSLWEINLRTYVEVDGIKGIYFFTLDTDSIIAEIVAKKFFNLPYRLSKIKAFIKEGSYHFFHQRGINRFELKADILLDEIKMSEFDLWCSERYCLFTLRKKQIYQGIVRHSPWKMQSVKINILKNNFTTMLLTKKIEPISSMYSSSLKVRFIPFKKIRTL